MCCLCSVQQTPEEELCNLLTNIIFSVMWSGSAAEGPDDAVWRERGQVFSVLTKLGSSYKLVRPPDDIKRRSVVLISTIGNKNMSKLNWKTISPGLDSPMKSKYDQFFFVSVCWRWCWSRLCQTWETPREHSCPSVPVWSDFSGCCRTSCLLRVQTTTHCGVKR